MDYAAGFDIGGTKCAVILGRLRGDAVPEILDKVRFETKQFSSPVACIAQLCDALDGLRKAHPEAVPETIGISCGGPLDPVRGIIQSPPNLPGWDDVPITDIVGRRTGLTAKLQNDANACALAEWKFGAGKGTQNMVFLTFGTGLGAGIIVNGRILNGASGMGGECGHIRLAPDGPVGYHKAGSFEGFCSGGGLKQTAQAVARAAMNEGKPLSWCPDTASLDGVNAKIVADAARRGDPAALKIFTDCGTRLGEGLALLIDILNPERIVIGSIFTRSEDLLRPAAEAVIRREALPQSAGVCQLVPAALGESIGDIAALTSGLD